MHQKKSVIYFLFPWIGVAGFVLYSMAHAHVAVCLSNYLPLALLCCLCWLKVPAIKVHVVRFGLLPLLSLSWMVLLGRLLLPLLAGPQWLHSMAMLYQVEFHWLVVGDVLLHFGCFFAVQWLWLWQAQAFKQNWLIMSKWQQWVAGYWVLLPYTIWLLCVNPLIVYKVPVHLTHMQLIGWLYGLLIASFGLIWATYLCHVQKRLQQNQRLLWWLYVVAMVVILLLAGYVDAVAPPWLIHLVVILIYWMLSMAIFFYLWVAKI